MLVYHSNFSHFKNSFLLDFSSEVLRSRENCHLLLQNRKFHIQGIEAQYELWWAPQHAYCTPRSLWLYHHDNTVYSYFVRNSRRSIKLDGKGEPKGAKRSKPVRYTAAKLHEKGVLLGIDDLQTNQWVWPRIYTQHKFPLIMPIKSDSLLFSFLCPLKRASFGLSRPTPDYRWRGNTCAVISSLPIRPRVSGAMDCRKCPGGHWASHAWSSAFGFASLPFPTKFPTKFSLNHISENEKLSFGLEW